MQKHLHALLAKLMVSTIGRSSYCSTGFMLLVIVLELDEMLPIARSLYIGMCLVKVINVGSIMV